jgi:mono/diheme cytochrome c family protein
MKNKVFVTLLAIISAFTFSSFQDNFSASVQRGKSVYEANCSSCHMTEGQGLEGAFPPLANTGRLTDKGRLVNIVVNGLSSPITVKGQDYNMEMTPMNLGEQEVADVLNYIRNSWGNKNPEIKVNEVKELKKLSN